jgi:hypothetical protein
MIFLKYLAHLLTVTRKEMISKVDDGAASSMNFPPSQYGRNTVFFKFQDMI